MTTGVIPYGRNKIILQKLFFEQDVIYLLPFLILYFSQ